MCIELFDTHCHLNLPESFPDPQPLIEEAKESGVKRLALVGLDPESSRRALELAEVNEGVYAIVGHHPNYSASYDSGSLKLIAEMASHPKAVAIGEIGLDYHWDYATREQQERCLRDQLELASEIGKPVVFHCREAYSDLLALLESRSSHPPYLMHCFSGSSEDAARALALGCRLGFDGPLTYKKSVELRALVASLPRDRVVLETDSPYMTPEPHRGKPNKPSYLPFIGRALADIWGVAEEGCARVTTENARAFFGV